MRAVFVVLATVSSVASPVATMAQQPEQILTGQAAFGDWRTDAPGVKRLITARDVPPHMKPRRRAMASAI